jgi:hypothetical protein
VSLLVVLVVLAVVFIVGLVAWGRWRRRRDPPWACHSHVVEMPGQTIGSRGVNAHLHRIIMACVAHPGRDDREASEQFATCPPSPENFADWTFPRRHVGLNRVGLRVNQLLSDGWRVELLNGGLTPMWRHVAEVVGIADPQPKVDTYIFMAKDGSTPRLLVEWACRGKDESECNVIRWKLAMKNGLQQMPISVEAFPKLSDQ